MKHYTKSKTFLRSICFLWGSVALGVSESAPDDPFPFPPRKATVVDISKDKAFRLQKLETPLPEKFGPDYTSNEDRDKRVLTVKTNGGVVAYEVAIPSILNIALELQRPDIPEAFSEARVTQTGKLILRYYELTEFIYSNVDKKFVLMPQYIKNGEEVYSASGWVEFSKDLYFTDLSAFRSVGDGIAIYDSNAQKVYQLPLPPDLVFEEEYASLFEYDSVHSIVEVKTLKKHQYGRDEEMEVTGNRGHYKIELVP